MVKHKQHRIFTFIFLVSAFSFPTVDRQPGYIYDDSRWENGFSGRSTDRYFRG